MYYSVIDKGQMSLSLNHFSSQNHFSCVFRLQKVAPQRAATAAALFGGAA